MPTTVTRSEVEVTPALRDAVSARLDGVHASVWESRWVIFRAEHGGTLLGHAVVVEEIGKHRPITFVVGLRPDGRVADVAVMAYREAYGGEIRSARFLSQYHDKGPADAVRPYRDIRNVAGATLSVEAASRAGQEGAGVGRGARSHLVIRAALVISVRSRRSRARSRSPRSTT
jgi:hypothetical protein